MKRLVEAGADLDALDDHYGFGVVAWAACFRENRENAEYLLSLHFARANAEGLRGPKTRVMDDSCAA